MIMSLIGPLLLDVCAAGTLPTEATLLPPLELLPQAATAMHKTSAATTLMSLADFTSLLLRVFPPLRPS
jgi:hypothetical protein